jgi:SAM-dependent methyltransferase
MIDYLLRKPAIYEWTQVATGSRISARRIRAILGPIPEGARILDAGGGTGIAAAIFARGRDYCCMDIDPDRVRLALDRGSSAFVGDCTRMPVASQAIDLVVLRAISHHLDNEGLELMMSESRRVLKPDGRLLFLDAIWAPAWIPGRVLWALDRGSHPRPVAALQAALNTHFQLERIDTYSLYHRYFLAVARPNGT